MIYRLISASNVIANVQDSFNIDDSDWIGRAGNWLNKGLTDLGVISELAIIHKVDKAIEFKVELPCDIKSLVAIKANGVRISRSNAVINHGSTNVGIDEVRYTILGDNYIEFETANEYYEDCEVTIHYKSLPVELFKPFGVYLPMIPDIDSVQDALAEYLMIKILTRGYKHAVLSLSSNTPATNPYLAYHGFGGQTGNRKKARLAIKRMDKDSYRQASAAIRSLNHPERYKTSDFKKL